MKKFFEAFWSTCLNFDCVLSQQTKTLFSVLRGICLSSTFYVSWVWGFQTISTCMWPFSKHRFFSLPFKTSSVSPHSVYHSHIQMTGWKRDGFRLLSLCLLNCPFPKTIQLKSIVLYFRKPHDISLFNIHNTNSGVFVFSCFQPEWKNCSWGSINIEGCLCRRSLCEERWKWQFMLWDRFCLKITGDLRSRLLRWKSFPDQLFKTLCFKNYN